MLEQDFDPWPEAAAELRDSSGPYQLAVVRREDARRWDAARTWGENERNIAHAIGTALQRVRGGVWMDCLFCNRYMLPVEAPAAFVVLDFYDKPGPTMTRCVCEECVGAPDRLALRRRTIAHLTEIGVIAENAQVLPPR